MYYLIKKQFDVDRNVIGYSVLGKSKTVWAEKADQFNLWDEADRNPETTRVAVDGNGDPILNEMGFLTLEDDPNSLALQNQEAEIALRIKRIEFGNRLIAIMSIRNDAKNLSPSEIIQLVQDFSDINTAWKNGSISTSRTLIDALIPDGTILTTSDKTAILNEIDSNWTLLGYE